MAVSVTWSLLDDAPAAAASSDVEAAALMLPRDIALNATRDGFLWDKGDVVLISGPEAIAQDIALSLSLIKGEYFADLDDGVAYFEEIWVKNPDLAAIKTHLRERIEARQGVKSVESLELVTDASVRSLQVNFIAQTDFGRLALQLTGGA